MALSPRELGKLVRGGIRGRVDPDAIARDEFGLEVKMLLLPPGRDYQVKGKCLIVRDGLPEAERRWAVASAMGHYLMRGDTGEGLTLGPSVVMSGALASSLARLKETMPA